MVIRGGGNGDTKRLVGCEASRALPELAANITTVAAGDLEQDGKRCDGNFVADSAAEHRQPGLPGDLRPAHPASFSVRVDRPYWIWQEIDGCAENCRFLAGCWLADTRYQPGMEVFKNIMVIGPAGITISHRRIIHA